MGGGNDHPPPCVSENPDGTTREAPYSPSTLVAGRGDLGSAVGLAAVDWMSSLWAEGTSPLYVTRCTWAMDGDGWRWCENEEFVVWEEDLKM